MIIDTVLSSVLLKYGIDYSSFTEEQKDALRAQGDYSKVVDALKFLVDDLGIDKKNIEKCPSVLYFHPEFLEENYNYLVGKEINKGRIEKCLHVLSCVPSDLKATYQYVADNYGKDTFNKNITILSTDVDRIKDIEERFSRRMSKSAILTVANTTLKYAEINSILTVCEKNGVEVTGSFFRRGIEELKEIISICQKENIKITGSIFRKSSQELKSIINVCKSKGVPIISSMFLKDSVEISKIIDICRENNIEITGSVFRRTSSEIQDIISVCGELNIEISGTVFLRDADEVRKIVQVCAKYGVPLKANIFKKSALEIEEIIEVCKKHGVEVSGSMFSKNASSLDKSMSYLEENYGKDYLTPLIVIIEKSHLERVFPYLEKKGSLAAVITTPVVLSLKYDELIEREQFIKRIGEADVVKGKFNTIYGLSRKRYKERVNSSEFSEGGNNK